MPELKTVSLDKIDIPDVRVSSILNEEQRALMASTIKEIGLVQDIVVRSKGPDAYELVAGMTTSKGCRQIAPDGQGPSSPESFPL